MVGMALGGLIWRGCGMEGMCNIPVMPSVPLSQEGINFNSPKMWLYLQQFASGPGFVQVLESFKQCHSLFQELQVRLYDIKGTPTPPLPHTAPTPTNTSPATSRVPDTPSWFHPKLMPSLPSNTTVTWRGPQNQLGHAPHPN